MTKHTEGPWEWDGNPCSYDIENEAPWLIGGNGRPILAGEIHCDRDANARLIAAAPELLVALENLIGQAVQQNEAYGNPNSPSMALALLEARAAIAKATA